MVHMAAILEPPLWVGQAIPADKMLSQSLKAKKRSSPADFWGKVQARPAAGVGGYQEEEKQAEEEGKGRH